MAGKTDQPEDVEALLRFCAGKASMQAIEVLPYHLLGVEVRGGVAYLLVHLVGAVVCSVRAVTQLCSCHSGGTPGCVLPRLFST